MTLATGSFLNMHSSSGTTASHPWVWHQSCVSSSVKPSLFSLVPGPWFSVSDHCYCTNGMYTCSVLSGIRKAILMPNDHTLLSTSPNRKSSYLPLSLSSMQKVMSSIHWPIRADHPNTSNAEGPSRWHSEPSLLKMFYYDHLNLSAPHLFTINQLIKDYIYLSNTHPHSLTKGTLWLHYSSVVFFSWLPCGSPLYHCTIITTTCITIVSSSTSVSDFYHNFCSTCCSPVCLMKNPSTWVQRVIWLSLLCYSKSFYKITSLTFVV